MTINHTISTFLNVTSNQINNYINQASKKTASFGGRFHRSMLICTSILRNSSISPSIRGHLHPKSVPLTFLNQNTTASSDRNTQSTLDHLKSALSHFFKVSQVWSENGNKCHYPSIYILRPRTVPCLEVSRSSNHLEIAGLCRSGHPKMG